MSFDVIILVALTILAFGAIYRIIKGPTVWDRLLGFSFFSAKIMTAAVLVGIIIDRTYMVDVALIYGLLGFIGTIMIARFIERKGDI